MIEVKHLRYKYKSSRDEVLRDISLSLRHGEIVALVGRNGSGKSTLGKLIAGIARPKRGEVLVDRIDVGVKRNYEKVFRKVGIVFQNPETQIIFGEVREEMEFALMGMSSIKGAVSDEQRKENARKITAALDMVGMVDKQGGNLWDFSLGQKQRIVLAEMLARCPQYLVLDEPTTMIDSLGKQTMYKIWRDLRTKGLGILLITNCAEELLVADRVLVLGDGRIVEEIAQGNLKQKEKILREYGVVLPWSY